MLDAFLNDDVTTAAALEQNDDVTTTEAAMRGVIQDRSGNLQLRKRVTSTARSWKGKIKTVILIKYLTSTSRVQAETANKIINFYPLLKTVILLMSRIHSISYLVTYQTVHLRKFYF